MRDQRAVGGAIPVTCNRARPNYRIAGWLDVSGFYGTTNPRYKSFTINGVDQSKNVFAFIPKGNEGKLIHVVGKATGKDAGAHKDTTVSILGVERAKQKLFGLVAEAETTLAPFGARAGVLKAAARFVAERRA